MVVSISEPSTVMTPVEKSSRHQDPLFSSLPSLYLEDHPRTCKWLIDLPEYRKNKYPSGFATSWMDVWYIYIYLCINLIIYIHTYMQVDVKKCNNISKSQNQGLRCFFKTCLLKKSKKYRKYISILGFCVSQTTFSPPWSLKTP